MAPWYLRWILSTPSRSSLKMQGFEPSLDLEFQNGKFQKGCQLNNFFLGTFLPSAMWSRDTVEMQGFELAATLVATSDFQNLFWGPRRAPGDPPGKGNSPSSLLPSALESRNRIPEFLKRSMLPRGLIPNRNAAIRAVARGPKKMQGFWPAAILEPPSADVESENRFFKQASQLKSLLLRVCGPVDVVTRHDKHAKSRDCDHAPGAL